MAVQRQVPLSCPGHTRPVVHLKYSEVTPRGSFFISACKDGKPMLRKGDTGDWVGTYEGHKGAVWGATITRDATLAATGAADFTAKLWNAQSGSEMGSLQHKHIVKTVDFSSDSSLLLTGCNDKIMRIFDINKLDSPTHELKGQTSPIKSALWGKEEHTVVANDEGSDINLWDTRTLQLVKQVKMDGPVMSFDLSWDKSILIVTHGKSVTFVDASSCEIIQSYPVKTRSLSASLCPDHSTYVVGGDDCVVYKFDYSTGAELESHKNHFGPVHCIRYSPDGEVYASGSEDGTIRLWQQTVGKAYGLWTNHKDNGNVDANEKD